jgi:PleD family two-component response regulator
MGQLKVTASMGVASTSQAEVLAAEELTRAADAALYRAKRGGRDRTEEATATDWALEPPPALGSISA